MIQQQRKNQKQFYQHYKSTKSKHYKPTKSKQGQILLLNPKINLKKLDFVKKIEFSILFLL